MAPLTDKQKWALIQQWERTQNIKATSRIMKVSVKTVRRWIERYTATGSIATKPRAAPEATMTEEACATGLDLMFSPEFGDAACTSKELYERGLTSRPLHRTTVARHVKKHAHKKGVSICTFRCKPAQGIAKATKLKRVSFCRAHKSTHWGNFMLTDRNKFLFKPPGVRVRAVQWGKRGEKPRAYSVNKPMSVNVYAGITQYGVTNCHVVAGTSKHKSHYLNKKGQVSKNITATEYHDVLTKTLLPGGAKLFSANGISHWVLQQDNDPSHKAAPEMVKSWSAKHSSSATVLAHWPPSSPDLNVIENCWADV